MATTQKIGNIEVITFYDKVFPIEFSPVKNQYFKTFDLPTETIVTVTRVVSPTQARYWEISHVLEGDRIVKFSNQKHRSVSDVEKADTWLYMAEYWDDNGDDGHVSYCLYGYVIVTPSLLKKYLDSIKARWGYLDV